LASGRRKASAWLVIRGANAPRKRNRETTGTAWPRPLAERPRGFA